VTYVELEPRSQRTVEVFVGERWVVGWLVGHLQIDGVLRWARVFYGAESPGTHLGWFEERGVREEQAA